MSGKFLKDAVAPNDIADYLTDIWAVLNGLEFMAEALPNFPSSEPHDGAGAVIDALHTVGRKALNAVNDTITEERDEEAEHNRISGKINRTPRTPESIDKEEKKEVTMPIPAPTGTEKSAPAGSSVPTTIEKIDYDSEAMRGPT